MLRQGVPVPSVARIPVDLPNVDFVAEERKKKRFTTRDSCRAPIVLSVARLDRDKRYVESLILQLSRARMHAYGCDVRIIGDGPERERLASLVYSLRRELGAMGNKVTLLGATAHLSPHYLNADCYVGLGTTVLEACAYGLPAVVATVSPDHDYSAGVFPVDEWLSFGDEPVARARRRLVSDVIREVLADPDVSSRSALDSARLVHRTFGLDEVMLREQQAYDRLIENGGRGMGEGCLRDLGPLQRAMRCLWYSTTDDFRERVGSVLKSVRFAR